MKTSPPRVLLVARNFPPLTGGMERLLYHTYLELAAEFKVALVGPDGCGVHTPNAIRIAECKLFPTWRFLLQCQWRAYRSARCVQPDLVLAGSGVTVPAALIAARLQGAPVISYLHGLDLVVRSRLYQSFFVPAIRRCDVILVNSRNTASLAQDLGISIERTHILPPGVSLPCSPAAAREQSFRARLNNHKGPILLSVGRITARKGLAEFVSNVMPKLVRRYPDLMLAIIGAEPVSALARSTGERTRIELAAARARLTKHVALLGSVHDEDLRTAYYSSDLLVFPVLDLPGDVEGFGMVAVEAAAHGLPTAAFASGGVPDAVKPGVSGYLVNSGDYGRLAEVILTHLESESREAWRARCTSFAKEFSWERFGTQLRQICRDLINRSTPGRWQ